MTHPASRRQVLLRMLAAATGTGLSAALAQTGAPSLPSARIIVSSGPGSTIDLLGRRTAERLQPGYAQAVIVENRTGASGQLAVTSVKAAVPDGATLLLVPTPYMSIFPLTYRNLPYRPDVDFAPVSMGASFDLAFAVGPMVPASVTSLGEFLAWCKQNPVSAHFGSPSAGSTAHFTGVMLGRAAGVKLDPVNYRGPTPAINDLVGGQIASVCSPIGDLQQLAAAGKCRLIGMTGSKRNRFAPEVRTFAEQGFRDIVVEATFGFFLPAATPAAQVAHASEAIRRALSAPEVQRGLEQSCMEVAGSTPAAYAAHLADEARRWAPVVKAIGFTAES